MQGAYLFSIGSVFWHADHFVPLIKILLASRPTESQSGADPGILQGGVGPSKRQVRRNFQTERQNNPLRGWGLNSLTP